MCGQKSAKKQYHTHHDKIGVERQDQSCGGSDTLSALKSHIERKVVSDNGSCAGVQTQQINILRMSGTE